MVARSILPSLEIFSPRNQHLWSSEKVRTSQRDLVVGLWRNMEAESVLGCRSFTISGGEIEQDFKDESRKKMKLKEHI